jgi:hypothetical protein
MLVYDLRIEVTLEGHESDSYKGVTRANIRKKSRKILSISSFEKILKIYLECKKNVIAKKQG